MGILNITIRDPRGSTPLAFSKSWRVEIPSGGDGQDVRVRFVSLRRVVVLPIVHLKSTPLVTDVIAASERFHDEGGCPCPTRS